MMHEMERWQLALSECIACSHELLNALDLSFVSTLKSKSVAPNLFNDPGVRHKEKEALGAVDAALELFRDAAAEQGGSVDTRQSKSCEGNSSSAQNPSPETPATPPQEPAGAPTPYDGEQSQESTVAEAGTQHEGSARRDSVLATLSPSNLPGQAQEQPASPTVNKGGPPEPAVEARRHEAPGRSRGLVSFLRSLFRACAEGCLPDLEQPEEGVRLARGSPELNRVIEEDNLVPVSLGPQFASELGAAISLGRDTEHLLVPAHTQQLLKQNCRSLQQVKDKLSRLAQAASLPLNNAAHKGSFGKLLDSAAACQQLQQTPTRIPEASDLQDLAAAAAAVAARDQMLMVLDACIEVSAQAAEVLKGSYLTNKALALSALPPTSSRGAPQPVGPRVAEDVTMAGSPSLFCLRGLPPIAGAGADQNQSEHAVTPGGEAPLQGGEGRDDQPPAASPALGPLFVKVFGPLLSPKESSPPA